MKVVHLTSVHHRNDTRIFIKQCRSLARNGYDVALVVADGKGNEEKDGVAIFDVGKPKNRLLRMMISTRKIHAKALGINAKIYHLHDPELIPLGIKLIRKGKKVIFDSHEDIPEQLLNKPYLAKPLRKIISGAYSAFQSRKCSKFDAIIAATSTIRDKFMEINNRVIDVNNYPIIEEFAGEQEKPLKKKNQVCYVGAITKVRGIHELVDAMASVTEGTYLALGGAFSEKNFENEVKSLPGWKNVIELGFLDRESISHVFSESVAGLVTLHPTVNYLDSLPVKMFEYMSAGLPVIASDFPLWKEIIEKNECGLCVDPSDPKAIAEAIDYLVTHGEEGMKMGENGRKAVEKMYNWNMEEKKLISLYNELVN